MSPTIYTVVSEFKFEVGSALVGSERVQNAVDGIAGSVDRAQQSLKGLGLSFVASFGLGATSFVGLLGQAIKTSDNFLKGQLVLSNIISSNMHMMSGDVGTFNDRLMVSSRILKDIAKDAMKFGLDENELASMTKMMAAMLVPKGLAGTNFGGARDLSRNLMKSAPSLGVDPTLVQGQLIRLLEDTGQADMNNTLFRRLTSETKAFKEALAGAENAAKKFNTLSLEKRFALVQAGLSQFASDMDVLQGMSLTVGNMMQRLRNIFVGFNGILKPIGDALMGPIRQAFAFLMSYLDNQVRRSIESFSGILKIFVSDIEKSAVNLMQARRFGSDFRNAGRVFSIALIAQFLAHLGLLGVVLRVILIPFALLAKLFSFLAPVLAPLASILFFVIGAITKFSLALLPILAIFQTISRAVAIAKVRDLKLMPGIIAGVMEQAKRFTDLMMIVFGPALEFLDMIADKMAWLFQLSFWLQRIVDISKFLVDVFVVLFGVIQGFVFSIGQFINNLSQGKILGAFDGVTDQFKIGVDDFFDKFLARTQNDDGSTKVANNITNIAKVEINNQFKEQMEPDRIAFTLRDQLLKAATNPQQASGRSLRGAALGN